MADLDDGPEQAALDERCVSETILDLADGKAFDLILTHGPRGEYTRHRRHEEVSRSVKTLWKTGQIMAKSLWMFAYRDLNRMVYPEPSPGADRFYHLEDDIWQEKYDIITHLYGFSPDSWEAHTTPHKEAFYCFHYPSMIDLEIDHKTGVL